jgi:hypothetical protein
MMKKFDKVKAHLKRNQLRYVVVGGVTIGFAIGLYTKRVPAKELTTATYQAFGPESPLKVVLTQHDANVYNEMAKSFADTLFMNSKGRLILDPNIKVPKEFHRVARAMNQADAKTAEYFVQMADVIQPLVQLT